MITEEKIWDYIDGGLDESERLLIADAITNDISVRLIYQDILAADSVFKSQTAERPSADFADSIIRSISPAVEYRPASKISLTPLILSALPFIAIVLILAYIFATHHSSATVLSLQINSHIVNSIKIVFILTDTVLFWLFVEKLWLHNRKQFSF